MENSEKTSLTKCWEEYLKQEPELCHFIPVVKKVLDIGLTSEAPAIKSQHFYAELVHWLKFGLKDPNPDLILLLKVYQLCLDQNISSKEKFEEISKILIFTLLNKSEKNSPDDHFEVFLETFNTLIHSSDCIFFFTIFEDHQEIFEQVTLTVLTQVVKVNDEKLIENFLCVLSKMLKDNSGKSFVEVFLSKKCVGAIIKIIRLIAKADAIDLGLEVLGFFIREYKGFLVDLKIRKVFKEIFKGGCGVGVVKKCFKILFSKLRDPKMNENALELKRIILELGMRKEVERDYALKVLKKMQNFYYLENSLSKNFKSEIKTLVLGSNNIMERIEYFDLILPWITEGFSVIEYKLLTKLCRLHKNLTNKILECLLEACRNTLGHSNYFKIYPDKPIQIEFDIIFNKSKEFSIWSKVNKKHMSDSEVFFEVKINNSHIFTVSLENTSLKIELIKGKSRLIVLNAKISLNFKCWNVLGLNFSLVSGKCQLGVHFNTLSFEVRIKEVGTFKELNLIKVAGKAKIEFIKVFSEAVSEVIFHTAEYKTVKKGLVFSLDPQNQLYSIIPVKCTCKAKVICSLSAFEVIKKAGTLNFFLPILQDCEDLACLVLFFNILTELSTFETFDSIFNSDSMLILSRMLKNKMVDMDLLDSIEGFLISIKTKPCYKNALEYFYLCPQIWNNLQNHNFIFYIEAVKTHLLNSEFVIEKGFDDKIIEFFVGLGKYLEETCRKVIFFYFFQIFVQFIKKSEEKVLIFVKVVNTVIDNVGVGVVYEEFFQFLNDMLQEKWRMSDERKLFYLLAVLKKCPFNEHIQITASVLSLCLKATKSFFFSTITKNSNEIQLEFIEKILNLVKAVTLPYIHPKILKVFINFLSKPKIAFSLFKKFVIILPESLFLTFKSKTEFCAENFEILILASRFCSDLASVICCHKKFPGWIFEFFEVNDDLPYLQPFLVSIFRHLSLFKNFDIHRILVFELIRQKKISSIFQFFSNFFNDCLITSGSNKNKIKYLLEFFNLVEDTINRIEYSDIPIQEYLEFLEICIIPLQIFQFSKSFTHLPGFISYSLFDKPNISINSNLITLRDGGLARQLLHLVFIGMSFKPNPSLENFISSFLQDELKSEENRIEWRALTQTCGVQRIGIVSKESQGSSKNLIIFYIFHEWAIIIRKYFEMGFMESDLMKSVTNFMFYVKQAKIVKRIVEEAKVFLDKKSFTYFEKVREENFNKMSTEYSQNPASEFSYLLRNGFNSQTYTNIAKFEDNRKNRDFYITLLEFAQNLEQSKDSKDFFFLLQKYWQNLEIQSFFIVLTSLKAKLLSSIFFTKAPLYNYSVVIPSSSWVFSQTISEPPAFGLPNELKFQFEYKKVIRDLDVFAGIFHEAEGKFYIKNSIDLIGRRVFTKLKNKEKFLVPEINDNLISESFEASSRSFSIENFSQSDIYAENAEQSNFSLEDLQDIVSSLDDLNTLKFSCELIKPYGNLVGKLTVYDDYLVFQSKSKEKTDKNMTVIKNSREYIYSTAPKESQILKSCTKIWKASEISEIFTRKFIQNLCALEIFHSSGKSHFFNFFTRFNLKSVFSKLKYKYEKLRVTFSLNKIFFELQENWKQGRISNFQYLMVLNKYSGRTFNDLSQYPVLPWVLSDYNNSVVDLKSESSFRNFSLPITAQTAYQQNCCKETFKLSKEQQGISFHCGTHYLSYATVLNYFIRLEPYTTESKTLYKQSFDIPDRIFASVPRLWQNLLRSQDSVKELVPEFFYLPQIFTNSNKEIYGKTQEGDFVDDVNLPNWANGNVHLFLIKHQQALESEFVYKNVSRV